MIRIILSAIPVLYLVACGGGGGSGPSSPPPTQSTPTTPVISAPPPSTSGGGLAASDARARIMAATTASATPVAGTVEPLPLKPGAKVVVNDIQHFIGLNKTDAGKFFGLSDQSGTHLVDPALVDKACFNSFETGWAVGGKTSRACAPIDPVTGYAELPINATCNRALGTWSVVLKDGSILWSDSEGDRAWEIEGLPVVRHTTVTDPLRGLIEYGAGGRQQPTAKAVVVGGKVDLTINFGSNCLGGFGLDDQLTNLMPAVDTYYKFLYNSDEKGWGIVQVGDRKPSTTEAYAEYDATAGSYSVTFKGLTCGDRGQITVYKGTGPSTNVVWDPGKDAKGEVGYGIGWFAIQKDPTELQLWVAQAPLTFDRDKYAFVLPACTA